jgi:hypothetical protein
VRGVLEAGFVFWGLFLAFGLFVVAYLVWMRRAERAEESSAPVRSQAGEEGP